MAGACVAMHEDGVKTKHATSNHEGHCDVAFGGVVLGVAK